MCVCAPLREAQASIVVDGAGCPSSAQRDYAIAGPKHYAVLSELRVELGAGGRWHLGRQEG